jgi:hypothetical protein
LVGGGGGGVHHGDANGLCAWLQMAYALSVFTAKPAQGYP